MWAGYFDLFYVLQSLYGAVLISSVSPYLNFDLLVTEQRYQMRDDARVDDHLDLLVPGVCQIGQSPHCVYQDLETAKKKKKK